MSDRKNRKARDSQGRLWVRILSIVLAALMILSVAYTALLFVIDGFAADAELERYAFETSKKKGTFHIGVAIRYGSSVTVSHAVTSPHGFVIGEALITRTERSFTPIYRLNETEVVVACDDNLSVGYKSCSLAKNASDTDIGAYHVQLSLNGSSGTEIWNACEDLAGFLGAEFEHVFPACVNGEHVIRLGAYADYSEASTAAATAGTKLDGYSISVASPSSTGICVLNEDYDTILFEYTGTDVNCSGAIQAVQPSSGNRAYLCYTANTYLYDGAFCFRRYISDGYNGLTLINLLPLREYIEGVLPAEIYPSWPIEVQKAFALTVCSFTISNLNKRFSTYGCDFVSSSSDQNYSGRHNVNDAVVQACAETQDQALCFEGDTLVSGYYSSSHGGYSVDTQYVWGGETGSYICSQPTPWEDYVNVSRGQWFAEITPSQLATAVKTYQAGAFTGNTVSKCYYDTCPDGSPFVYSMRITDNKGTTFTVTRTSRINSLLSNWVYSANFVMGRGSVKYTYDTVDSVDVLATKGFSGNLNVFTADGAVSSPASKFNFFTSLGQALRDRSGPLYVKTADGTATLTSDISDIPVATSPDKNGKYTFVSDYGSFLIVSHLTQHTATKTASNSNNYVIAGRGFGHGVGMSAYGMYHLAKAGATYDQILFAYYPGTEIVDIYDYWARH